MAFLRTVGTRTRTIVTKTCCVAFPLSSESAILLGPKNDQGGKLTGLAYGQTRGQRDCDVYESVDKTPSARQICQRSSMLAV